VTDIEVRDVPAEHRFELLVDGEPAGLAAYRLRDGVVVVTHSEVRPDLRGQGLAGELARRSLDDIRASGRRVVPQCPYYARYVDEHPEYLDIVDTMGA
jgi:predicted GNAT family acetyltransferase